MAQYARGKYGWIRELETIKQIFENQLQILHTDYADIGFVHGIDEMDDYQKVMSNGIWEHMEALKRNGVIRHPGLSSHDPEIIRRFLDTGIIDMVMFGINPAYDYSAGTYGIGTASERGQLYRECEREGVGISAMKPFGGGQLLNAKTSPLREMNLQKDITRNFWLKRAPVCNAVIASPAAHSMSSRSPG